MIGAGAMAFVRYQKLGIYFKLHMDAISNIGNSSTSRNRYRIYIQFENLWYRIRCKESVGPTSHPWWNNSGGTTPRYVVYSGGKALNGYHLKARVRIEDTEIPSPPLLYSTYFSEWAKINVNSPYY